MDRRDGGTVRVEGGENTGRNSKEKLVCQYNYLKVISSSGRASMEERPTLCEKNSKE
jgi:hypothetical protein